ncbi:hypothetical protein VNO77_02641 [Canavalia gladiata]|uniref:Uncharacterized protein n=1 Tax=Canavalia gladiata TaxID=3824 RepID=A0AAN9RBG3_CANGL
MRSIHRGRHDHPMTANRKMLKNVSVIDGVKGGSGILAILTFSRFGCQWLLPIGRPSNTQSSFLNLFHSISASTIPLCFVVASHRALKPRALLRLYRALKFKCFQ